MRCALFPARSAGSARSTADGAVQPDEHLGCRVLVRGYIADRAALANRVGLVSGARVTDGELLAHAFRTWGRDVQAHVLGEYAAVVCDVHARTALITHDALGIAPLFYARRAGGVAFATDILDLVDAEASARIDDAYLAGFLVSGVMNGQRTPYPSIARLVPGQSLWWADGELRPLRTWNLADVPAVRCRDDAEYEERFRALLCAGVDAARDTAGPTWISLSGGLDSSSIASVAARDNAHGLAAYSTMCTSWPDADEERWMRAVVERYELPWHRADIETMLPFSQLPSGFDGEPTQAVIGERKMQVENELLRSHGARVMLSGQAGDTVLCASPGEVPEHLADSLFEGDPAGALRALREWKRGARDGRSQSHWLLRGLAQPAVDSPAWKARACRRRRGVAAVVHARLHALDAPWRLREAQRRAALPSAGAPVRVERALDDVDGERDDPAAADDVHDAQPLDVPAARRVHVRHPVGAEAAAALRPLSAAPRARGRLAGDRPAARVEGKRKPRVRGRLAPLARLGRLFVRYPAARTARHRRRGPVAARGAPGRRWADARRPVLHGGGCRGSVAQAARGPSHSRARSRAGRRDLMANATAHAGPAVLSWTVPPPITSVPNDALLRLLRAGVAAAPDRPELALQLAKTLARADRMPELIERFRSAADRDDTPPEIRYLLGYAAAATNDFALAVAALQPAADAGYDAAFGLLAEALERVGRADDALAIALRGVQRSPSDFRSFGIVVRLLLERGEAERLWRTCAELRARGTWNAYVPSAMALSATTAAQVDEVAALIDAPRWLSETHVAVPDGFNDALAAELLAHPSLAPLPSTKATSGTGSRIDRLQAGGGPHARNLLERIRAEVDAYVLQRHARGRASDGCAPSRARRAQRLGAGRARRRARGLAHASGRLDQRRVLCRRTARRRPREPAPGRDRIRPVAVRHVRRRARVAARVHDAESRPPAAVSVVLRTPHLADARRGSAHRRRVRRGLRYGAGATAMTCGITGATVVSRSPSVVTADIEDEIMMLSIVHGRYWSLDVVGSEIWRRIEPPCSFDRLVDALAAEYDADRATIEADVQTLLARMSAEDVVRLT